MRASLRTIPLADPYTSDSVITLDQIRSGPRRTNDYVDSPRAVAAPPIKSHLASHSKTLVGGGGGTSPGFANRVLPPVQIGGPSAGGRLGGGGGDGLRSVLSSSSVVSQQPVSKKPCHTNLDKNINSDLDGGGGGVHTNLRENGLNGDNVFGAAGTNHRVGGGQGIICEKCQKCRCSDCTDTKPLPSHWCCGNVCEMSPEKVLDACTCFCCVKAAMYHFGNEEDYDNPCGCCSTSHCMRRWTLMSVMAVCLPCLWAYWPARGCLAACTAAYNGCWRGRKGCDCQCNIMKLDPDTKSSVLSRGNGGGSSGGVGGGGGTSKNSQSRRLLLIDSDSSSTST